MTKKIISFVLLAVILCLCSCSAGEQTVIDSYEVAAKSSEELMEKIEAAINNQDLNSFNQLTTDTLRASNSDVVRYFDKIKSFKVNTVAFESNEQNGASYEIPIHYYISFGKDYTGSQYKTGLNNMTDGFTIVKIGDNYKLDAITRYGSY